MTYTKFTHILQNMKFNLIAAYKRPAIKIVEKSWGRELWIANDESNNYCGKILTVKRGHRFSMHFHDKKVETFYVSKGKLKVWLLDLTDASVHEGLLEKGDCLDLPRLQPHEVEAIEDSEILEFSTFHKDEDSFRVWRKM